MEPVIDIQKSIKLLHYPALHPPSTIEFRHFVPYLFICLQDVFIFYRILIMIYECLEEVK